MNAQELKANIVAVHAISTGKAYRVEIEMKDGERIVIKKKGTKAPSMVQLYDLAINGNAARVGPSQYFTFAKSTHSWYKDSHLKSYPVRFHHPKNS